MVFLYLWYLFFDLSENEKMWYLRDIFSLHLQKKNLRFINKFCPPFQKLVVNKQKIYFSNSGSTIIKKLSILSYLIIKYIYLYSLTPNRWKYHTVCENCFEIPPIKYKQKITKENEYNKNMFKSEVFGGKLILRVNFIYHIDNELEQCLHNFKTTWRKYFCKDNFLYYAFLC